MLKKTLAAVGIAGMLILGSATSAFAGTYPPTADVSVSAPSVAPGGIVTITAEGLGDRTSVTFDHNAPAGSTLSSLSFAAAVGGSVVKSVSAGTSSARFSSTTPGTYTIRVLDGASVLGSASVTVTASGAGADTGLPDTGGSVPAAAIWAGVGLIGVGGIALAAVAARRRTQKH